MSKQKKVIDKYIPPAPELPAVKRDTSKLKPDETGFLEIGTSKPTHDYDVGGTWRLLYTNDEIKRSSKKPSKMKIFVRTTAGEKIPLSVKPKETIDGIKDMVNKKAGIPKDEQRLLFDGKPLDNDQSTLSECDIKDGDILQLEDLIKEPMKIHIKTPKGKKITLEVDPEDTIDDIKDRIEEKTGIPSHEQRPTHKGKSIKDGTTLLDNKVPHNGIINLEPMKIFVRDEKGKKYPQKVHPTDTIESIKEKIENDTGISPKDQRLTFGGKPLHDNQKTLRDCGIKHKSTLDLEPMKIHVNTPNGEKITLDVSPDDTIDDIKEKVRDKTGIPIDEQRPQHNGRPLPGDTTLSENGILHDETIDLEPMQIFVRDPKGKKYTLDVDPSDTIDHIKKKIENDTGIPKEDQRLAYDDEPLDDNRKTLRDCGVKHKSTLDLKPIRKESPSKPKKKSYLPENWKEEQDRYGQITETTYETVYDVNLDEGFIRGKIEEKKYKVDMKVTR